MNELERIKKSYKRRDLSDKKNLYSFFNPAFLFTAQQREKAILKAFSRIDFVNLSDRRILDVGCGYGGILREFIRYGANPENCFGIDILPDRIKAAKKLSPNMNFRCQNAEQLPYDIGYFDIVLCFTVFTSIFDDKMKKNIAIEMLRVLKHDGIILFYDYHVNNPKNPDVRRVKKREIYELFPNCNIYFKRITFAPPIARMLTHVSIILCEILEKIPFLCTHYLAVINKKGKP